MTDHPALMKPPMVRALLREIEQPGSGKTMNRRLAWSIFRWPLDDWDKPWRKPTIWQKVRPGDNIWVRETFAKCPKCRAIEYGGYRSRCGECSFQPIGKNKPSIHMPRWASRLTLTVTATKMERLQEISETDARAEGVRSIYGEPFRPDNPMTDRRRFQLLWDTLHPTPPHRWEDDPECVAVTFVPHLCNIDTMSIPRD